MKRLMILPLLAGALLASAPTTPPAEATNAAHAPHAEATLSRDVDAAILKARQVMMSDPSAIARIGDGLTRRAAAAPAGAARDAALSRARWMRAESLVRSDEATAAESPADDAIRLARSGGSPQAEAAALLTRGSIRHVQGRYADELRDYLRSALISRRIGDVRGQAVAYNYLGILYDQAADYDQARHYYQMARSLRTGDPHLGMALESSMGVLAGKNGDHVGAQRHFVAAEREASRADAPTLAARMRVAQAEALLGQGRRQEALAAVESGIVAGAPDKWARQIKALVLSGMGRDDEATALIDGIDRTDSRNDDLHDAAYLIYKKAGRDADALREIEARDALRSSAAELALSTKASILASRFDWAGQEIRIARMNAEDARRRAEYRIRLLSVFGIGAATIVALLIVGIVAVTRSRNREHASALALGEALKEVKARADAEREAIALAEHDHLTGLPNRRTLPRLAAAFDAEHEAGRACAVLALDLDRFKAVNDVHGHDTGDSLLKQVAERLTGVARMRSGAVIRMGGDEFAIVVTGACDPAEIEALAADVVTAVGVPFDIDGRRHQIGTSVGVACHPQDGRTIETLLVAADIAMYEAKRAGRGTYRMHDAELEQRQRDRATLETDLRSAVVTGAIEPWFQPIVDVATGRIVQFEALARWRHPTRGMIPPDVFIPIAEETRMIDEITTHILQQACRVARQWPEDVSVSVNISPVSLRDSWIIAKTFGILHQEHLHPSRLVVEITENAVIGDMAFAREVVDAFRDAGMQVALDDFGRGYSSLSTLRELAFDHIKLDRSFVNSLSTDEGMMITTAVAGLARAMQLTATAEGVEDEATRRLLERLGFDRVQGYLHGMAAPGGDTLAMIEAANGGGEAVAA